MKNLEKYLTDLAGNIDSCIKRVPFKYLLLLSDMEKIVSLPQTIIRLFNKFHKIDINI